jgi:hypothetical protein
MKCLRVVKGWTRLGGTSLYNKILMTMLDIIVTQCDDKIAACASYI